MSWLLGIGPIVGPLLCVGLGYWIGYRDARGKYGQR